MFRRSGHKGVHARLRACEEIHRLPLDPMDLKPRGRHRLARPGDPVADVACCGLRRAPLKRLRILGGPPSRAMTTPGADSEISSHAPSRAMAPCPPLALRWARCALPTLRLQIWVICRSLQVSGGSRHVDAPGRTTGRIDVAAGRKAILRRAFGGGHQDLSCKGVTVVG